MPTVVLSWSDAADGWGRDAYRYDPAAMAETTQTVEDRLEQIGTQLAWVRDYL